MATVVEAEKSVLDATKEKWSIRILMSVLNINYKRSDGGRKASKTDELRNGERSDEKRPRSWPTFGEKEIDCCAV